MLGLTNEQKKKSNTPQKTSSGKKCKKKIRKFNELAMKIIRCQLTTTEEKATEEGPVKKGGEESRGKDDEEAKKKK